MASMKKCRYVVYIHLCQTIGNIQYAKCSCKAGAGGLCKHVAAVRRVSDEKSFSVCQEMLPLFRAVIFLLCFLPFSLGNFSVVPLAFFKRKIRGNDGAKFPECFKPRPNALDFSLF